MSEASALQLRIYSGIHAGASEILSAERYVLGADSNCDVVLADAGVAPRHAELHISAQGCILSWLASDASADVPDTSISLALGSAFALGPVVMGVDLADAPWAQVELLTPVKAPSPNVASVALAPDTVDASVAEMTSPPAGSDSNSDLDPTPTVGWMARNRRRVIGGVLTCSALALVGVMMDVVVAGAPAAASYPALVTPAQQSEQQRLAILQIAASLKLAEQIVIEATAHGGWLVRAAYLNDTQVEALAMALSRLNPRPGLQMTNEQDLQQSVNKTLAGWIEETHDSVKATYLGEAVFELSGSVASPSQRAKLLTTLAVSFPMVREWKNQFSVPQETANMLLEALRESGFDVTGTWKDGTLFIQTLLSKRQVQHWEVTLVDLAGKYTVPFSAIVRFGGEKAVSNFPVDLPFTPRSVMGGNTPYVVMSDGAKLMLDGVRQGWRLSSISHAEIVFENGSRRAVLQR
jgi:type III secretion protein D